MKKLGAIHVVLYLCALVFPAIALRWPQWWPVAVGGLTVAHLVAINTHKPGAADLMGKVLGLAADAAKKTPLPVLFLLGSLFVVACMTLVIACAPKKVARTEYGAQLQACIDTAHNRAEADACVEHMKLVWNEAGAPPALVFDGGPDQ